MTTKRIGKFLRVMRDASNYREILANDGTVLGTLEWHRQWQQYVLVPVVGTIWSTDCLRDVATYIELGTVSDKEPCGGPGAWSCKG